MGRLRRPKVIGVLGLALSAVLIAAASGACTGPDKPKPTTDPSTTLPTSTGPPTARQIQCRNDGTFLISVGTELARIVASEGTTPGSSDEEQAITDTQAQILRLNRPVHQPFVADRAKLIVDANDIVAGNQGLIGRGNHHTHQLFFQQVTRGGNEALTTTADAKVKRLSCVP